MLLTWRDPLLQSEGALRGVRVTRILQLTPLEMRGTCGHHALVQGQGSTAEVTVAKGRAVPAGREPFPPVLSPESLVLRHQKG